MNSKRMQGEAQVILDKDSFKALSSEVRTNILRALEEKRMTLTDLSRDLNLAKPTLLEHLAKLEAVEFIRKEDEGRKWIYYSLSKKGRRILHPERARFRILFAFSLSMISVGIAGLLAVWYLRSQRVIGYACCGDPILDTYIPMTATFIAIFGLLVMVYAFRELDVRRRKMVPAEDSD